MATHRVLGVSDYYLAVVAYETALPPDNGRLRFFVRNGRCTKDGFPRLLPYLVDTAKNKSAAIRRRCLDYAMLALARWSDAAFDRCAVQLRCDGCLSLSRLASAAGGVRYNTVLLFVRSAA